MFQSVIKHLKRHLKLWGEKMKPTNDVKNELDEILKKLDEAEKEFTAKMKEFNLAENSKKVEQETE